MSDGNIEVLAQPASKPRERWSVGWITYGCTPDADDYRRWGIDPDSVIQARQCKRGGKPVLLVVVP